MEVDLAYFRHRTAAERAAADCATHQSARAAHLELARLYDERIAALEAEGSRAAMRFVSAA